MNTYFLKNLSKHIVAEGSIGKEDVQRIISLLSAKDLRKLTGFVMLEVERATAYITTADELSKKDMSVFQSLFHEKNLINITDKKIGAGIKVQSYDMIYDLSIKSKLENVAKELEETI